LRAGGESSSCSTVHHVPQVCLSDGIQTDGTLSEQSKLNLLVFQQLCQI
jgi:hypothetical protein